MSDHSIVYMTRTGKPPARILFFLRMVLTAVLGACLAVGVSYALRRLYY